jgi:hypothetical protein
LPRAEAAGLLCTLLGARADVEPAAAVNTLVEGAHACHWHRGSRPS